MDAGTDRSAPSLRRKLLITAFIVFHFGCVAVWVFPGNPPARGFLLARSVPLPVRQPDPATDSMRWRFEPTPIIASYLGATAQWQHWALFAPNPIPFNRYLGCRVTRRSGHWKEHTLPRVEQLDYFHAHLGSQFREYQYGMTGPQEALEDLARFFARAVNDPANPVVFVELYSCQMEMPRHDRPELRAPGPRPSVDYSRLLRDESLYVRYPLVAYAVKPEDLR